MPLSNRLVKALRNLCELLEVVERPTRYPVCMSRAYFRREWNNG